MTRATVRSEDMRQHALDQLKLIDTPQSESFDRITRLASQLFSLPIAAVSLTDRDRQWFKSRVGVEHREIPRERAPCGQVADTGAPLVIPDLLADSWYRDSPLARSGIRFYAGAPLVTRDGLGLGSMCVLGTEPREVTPEETAMLSDLAAMVMAQIELQHAFGRIEPLSGLPNRHQLLDDLSDAARDRPNALRSLVIVETIETMRVSEALRVLGPGAMDDLVRTCTRIIHDKLGPEIKVFQVGPMQFAWLVEHDDTDDGEIALARLSRRTETDLAGLQLPSLLNPVIGIRLFRLGTVSPDDVLRTTFSAAQDARNAAARVGVYSEAADDGHRRRFKLLADMADALVAPDQLSLVFQPRIDLRTGACVGVEALLRWKHPVLGNVPPGEFIPLVEQTDLARPLTEWVIGQAIGQALAWRDAGLIAVPISVNVSAANLEEPDFGTRLVARLATSGLPPEALEVEVTESALIRDGARVGRHLQQIRHAGIRVAIDDFGTGYSSLSYLQTLPADVIKIDQSFIRDLATNDRLRTLVRSLVAMARNLDFDVVAEGVEDEQAYEFLKAAACNEMQGYFISRPLPPGEFSLWFAAHGAGA